MRLARAVALLLVAAARAAAHEADASFAPTLPAAVGDVSEWEVITGDFETVQMRGSYRLYVNPARLAMYQLMRYQVELLGQGDEYHRAAGERVAFVRRPGTAEPMLLWARDAAVAGTAWRSIGPDNDEYKAELRILMGVLAIHRAARAGTAPAAYHLRESRIVTKARAQRAVAPPSQGAAQRHETSPDISGRR
jgi:hypothetical protein